MNSLHRAEKSPRAFQVPAVFFISAAMVMTSLAGCHGKKPESAKVGSDGDKSVPVVVPVSVSSVEVRAVQRRVSVVGTLHGFERITITPKVEGRVQAMHFDVGDRVAPGKTLLELDSTDYQLAVDEAQQALNQELSRLDLKQPPPNDFDVEQLPGVESANLLFKNAHQKFDRQKTLLSQNASSGQAYEQAETDMKVADAALRLSRVNARTTLAAIKHRESLLTLAQQKLSETQGEWLPLWFLPRRARWFQVNSSLQNEWPRSVKWCGPFPPRPSLNWSWTTCSSSMSWFPNGTCHK